MKLTPSLGKPHSIVTRVTSVMSVKERESTPQSSLPAHLDADAGIEALYVAHWQTLVRLSLLLVRDLGTAEEVVQEAFIAVHGRWTRLRDPDQALAYLRKAVVNRSRSALRHRTVVTKHSYREPPPATAPPADESVVRRDTRESVLDALRSLPTRQREVMALRYYLDLSEADIAAALGISRGAVKSHASRGAAALRELLDGLRSDDTNGHQ